MSDLDELSQLGRSALQARWLDAFGSPPPACFYKGRLIQGIAYREQVQRSFALQQTEKLVRRRVRLASPTGTLPQHVRLHPGARLLREWNGETHEVTVTDGGFAYRDKTYKSLSAIARTITGTRWSGPAFFGLLR